MLALSLCLAVTASGQDSSQGQFVVCIVGWGCPEDTTQKFIDRDVRGMKIMAELAHKYGFPVTWYLKPAMAEAAKADLQAWHEKYGDEVAWEADHRPCNKPPEEEIKALKQIVSWDTIRSAGFVEYSPAWREIFERNGMTSVWGRCWEQSYSDGISDRGSPWGFYYSKPDCFKVPNPGKGGMVSVEWVSRDLNLAFRTGWPEAFQFCPYGDPGTLSPGHCEYWFRLMDEYKRQARYNKFVPVIIENEHIGFGFRSDEKTHKLQYEQQLKLALPEWDELFAYMRQQGIKVMTVSEAVEAYRKLNPEQTPPSYALFDNWSKLPIFKNLIKTVYSPTLKVRTDRITQAPHGKKYNGYYPVTTGDGVHWYYHPAGKTFEEQPPVFIYYDANGQLFFDKGNPQPIRITSYLNLPPNSHKARILPEYSYWFDTDKNIPTATIKNEKTDKGQRITVEVVAKEDLPYGVMLWGDYSTLTVPTDAPRGTKVIGNDGLFIPMVLHPGENNFEIQLKAVSRK